MQTRALHPSDLPVARELLSRELADAPYFDRLVEILTVATEGTNAEYQGLVATVDGDLHGIALFGQVSGAVGAARVFAIAATPDDRTTVTELIDAMHARLRASGNRLVIAELPDDPALVTLADRLRSAAFTKAGSVPDLVRDGVALDYYRFDYSPPRHTDS